MPDQDAVVAITSGVKNMQAVLNLVWEKLLPAMQTAPLPDAAEAHDKLQGRLATLLVPVQDWCGLDGAGQDRLRQAIHVPGQRPRNRADGHRVQR